MKKKNKDRESDALLVYHRYWDSYSNGDLEAFTSTLDEGFEMIGTSESEVCHSKDDGIAFFKSQMHEIVGRTEMRNRNIVAKEVNGMFLINEICDVYIFGEPEWTFYSRLRLSTLLHETESGWKVIQQHGSLPDMRVQAGETIAFDKISKENLELRDAVRRRTAELENKNRELAIEAALEKVRAVAMGMKNPNAMLDVCRVIAEQLEEFGVTKIRNVQTAIIDEHIGQYLCYQYFPAYGQTTIEDTEYHKSPVEHEMVRQMLASRDGHFTGSLSGKELEEFGLHRKEENHFPDPLLDAASEVSYCFLSIGEGGLGLSLYKEMEAGVLELFKRFHQVFSLAYQRFRDIQKAEAQTREAQIEVAVERVRAQSMAMHHPDELDKVNKEILTQLNWLQIRGLSSVTFYLVDQDGWVKAYDFSSPGNIGNQNSYTLQFDFKKYEMLGYPFKIFEQTDLNYFVADYPLEKLEKAVFEKEEINPEVATVIKEALAKGILTHQWTACARITDGLLGIDLVNPPSEDTKTIVLKIAGAFNQAYQRFLDLQKAEAQAREAQIEAALERIRSRALAMHTSNEIFEVAFVLREQMGLLGQPELEASVVHLYDTTNGIGESWHAFRPANENLGEITQGQFQFQKDECALTREFFELYESGQKEYTIPAQGEQLRDWVLLLIEKSPDIKKSWGGVIPAIGYHHFSTFSGGALLSVTREEVSEEGRYLQRRAASVFDLAYKRYLDLQKAEAQAREAQIEAALERVRSRSMGMQKSIELGEVVNLLDIEIKGLSIKVSNTSIITEFSEKENGLNNWFSARGKNYLEKFHIPYSTNPGPVSKKILDAVSQGIDYYTDKYSKEEKDEYFKWLFKHSDFRKVPEDSKQLVFSASGWTRATVVSKNSLLIFQRFFLEEFSEQEVEIFKRFGKVFEQTYTRFLDLQKAEAQAREAQIEAALERVRAKTMAMHNSEDVSSAIATLFSELDRQSIENVRCGIAIIDTNKTMEVWSVTNVEETHPDKSLGKMVKASGTLDMNVHKLWQLMYDAWRNKTGYLYYHLSGKDKQKYIDLINTAPGYLSQPLRELPDMHCQFYFFNEGAIWAYSLQPHTEPQQPVMKRFTSVFSQTYLRYRDLQKAEAQAREAQIEAALERVRSRSMAMHKSEELKEVIQLLFEQFRLLNFKIDSAQFDPNYKENDDLNLWTAAPGQPYSILLNIPYVDSPLFNSIKEAKKRGLSFITQQLSYEDKNQFFRHFFQHIKNIPAERQKLIFDSPGMYRAVVFMENVSLAIQNYSNTPYTEEENEVLKRFGKTFEQVYTRFLDLQKAEAQTREAQIEAALERVRSRSLAMHHSSELSAVVDTLLREFTSLEFTLTFCIINLIDEQDMSNTVWAANPETGKDPESYYMKFEDYPFHHAMWDAWKAQKKRFVYTIEGKEKKIYDEYLYSETEFRRFPKHVQEANKALDRYVAGFTFFKYSGLQMVSLNPISEDELEILERFGRVFEQAYTRFLDLQKAEAQAREAQIQLALERVRARTMSMQKSQELPEAANLLFQQIQSLGMPAWSAGYCTWKEDLPTEKEGKSAVTLWMSSEGVLQPPFTAPTTEDKLFIQMREGAEKGKDLHVVEMGGEELEQHYRYMRELPVVGEILDSIIEAGHPLPTFQIMHQAYFSKGFLLFITYEPVPESHDIFKRFAKVFDQTYTRFLDLQKAEAQAREAKIEAALERVRSRTMAMFKSEELSEVAEVLFTQVSQLGGMPDRISICVIDEPNQSYQVWATDQAGNQLTVKPVANLKEKTTIRHLYADWKSGKKSSLIELKGPELKEWIAYLRQELGMPISTNHLQGRRFHNVAYFSHGWLNLSTSEPVADEVRDLLQRFASVFSLTYTRFLDLQKAEAQAREAQIEASLERVRSTSLAMHTSQDLSKVVYVVFTELIKLDAQLDRCLIQTVNPETLGITWYLTGKEGLLSNNGFLVENNPHPSHQAYLEGWRTKRKKWHYLLEGEEKKSCDEYLFSQTELAQLPDFIKADMAAVSSIHLTISSDDFGCLIASSISPLPEAHAGIVDRFTSVFNQTYTRFLDLQKAEAQARESQIEAALERVRSRAMAMHNSQELKEVALELRKQMGLLGQKDLEVCAIHLYGYGEDSFESWSAMKAPGSETKIVQSQAHFPKRGIRIIDEMMRHYTIGTKDYVLVNEGEKMAEWFKVLKKHAPELHASILDSLGKKPLKQLKGNWAVADFSGGALVMVTYGEPDEVSRNLLRRSANVFEQAYVRFLDLQKAEAQAREAKIEAALEKVRSRTMAMQRSEELPEVAGLLFQQVKALGVPQFHCGFNIFEIDDKECTWYPGSADGDILPPCKIPLTEHPIFMNFIESRKRGDELCVYEKEGEYQAGHYRYMLSLPVLGDILQNMLDAGIPFPTFQIDHLANFSHGNLLFITSEHFPEMHDTFKRFAKVFEQTYTRFLDLQKAEAQAREAQIEAALERVRSRSMGMQRGADLKGVVKELYDQLRLLGFQFGVASIIIMDADTGDLDWWMEGIEDGYDLPEKYHVPYFDHKGHKQQIEHWKNGNNYAVVEISGIEKKAYDTYYFFQTDFTKAPENSKSLMMSLEAVSFSMAYMKYGSLSWSPSKLDENQAVVLQRMAKVFEQTYTRFLDLQKAEAQAREAQVEAALERLRSKTMAMHNSKDVGESVATLFDELTALGVLSSYDRCGIGIMQPHEMMEVWTAEKSTGKTELTIGYLDMRPHALLRNVYQSWLDRKETFHYTLEGEDKQLYAESIVNQPRYKIRKDYFSSLEVIEHTDFFFEEGCLYIFSVQPISNESAAVFSRFVKVFGQTYRRYLDLQKAEKQAREAQIEAALEKVRSRSLAMQSPDELIEVARLLREEMGALGVEELETSSIYIQDESSGLTQCWFTIKNPDNPDKAITDQMVIDLQDTWVGQKMDEFYRSKAKQTSILMQGEERIEWIRYCEEKSDLFGTSNFYGETIPDRTYHLYKFSNGYIGAAAPGEISKESWDLLKRATTVFSFAYTRFRDIQMAQSSARAAMRQASLDRVRADISSMRNAEDLDRITPLIFKELTVLGVPFIRCGVFIIQEKQKIVEAYLSSPEGNSLGVLRLPYQASELTYQTVEAWRKGEVYRQHWNKEDFIRWINQLMELDQIQDSNTYQGSAAPPESLDLHFVPFTQGMIYVGAVYPLDDKDLELVQVLAKAFSIAYARFEDFVKLEQAKAEIESAMSELKATQSQLVQQEKLASLGQLTAGIAHEIKNPLNFVNNFSEVSIEMIEEALEEMEKREARDETLIRENLEDIKSNLKKVHEHGSRANGIVTSMLQHSRGGTGKKEATDLNALIQEYVNLSFHGMRAGKNPINVDIILDLDPEIKEVSLIKEDFSRVIINLCNNAFDAMKSVKTLHAASLRVSTKKQGDKITIEVSDNGPGIPDDIKDKILQPFFTTKKGTEGTGLGLSITHDIIKAHGGELEIETSVNKGTKFIIKLTK